MNKTAVRFFVVFALICVIAPTAALAVSIGGPIVPCSGPDCTVCSLATLAQRVLNAGIFIAVFFSAVLFAWAGWKYVSNMGNESQVSEAKTLFFNVMVGFVIILAAWLIVDVLMRTFTGNAAWSKLCG